MKINTKHHVTKNDLLKGNKPNKLHTTIQPNWRPFQIQIWTFQTFIRNIPALCSIAHPIIVPYFPALWTHTALWEHKLSLFQFQRNLVQLNDYRHVSLTYIVMKYLKKNKKQKKNCACTQGKGQFCTGSILICLQGRVGHMMQPTVLSV